MDIGSGDRVEYVGGPFDMPTLVIGRLYTVACVHPGVPGYKCLCHKRDDVGGLRLVEVETPPSKRLTTEFWWCTLCFRKRPPHREALFRSLLEPTTIRESEDA